MDFLDKISEDLKDSMKRKDSVRTSALRMIRTEVVKKKKETGKITQEEIIAVLQSMVRRYHDSIEQFRKGGREDLAENEEAQLKVVESYLPEKVSPDEIMEAIQDAIKETGAMSQRDFGKVMGLVMRRLKEGEKIVDGKEVKEMVSSALAELEKA